MPRYNAWEILLAWIPNSDGTPPPYPHRCIYLCDSEKSPGHVVVIGITSNPQAWREGYSTELPYADVPGGHPITGLTRRSLAQADWHDHISQDVVREVVGYVPEEYQERIRECIACRVRDIRAAGGAGD